MITVRRGRRTTAAGFVAMFVTIGTGFSYGVLAAPAAAGLDADIGVVSGAFAVTVMSFFLLGAPAGILADRYGSRVVLGGGAVLLGAGLLVTAAAREVWVLYAGHGVLVGAAMATAFIPLTASVTALFPERPATAVGIAVSGIGVGTLVMAPLLASAIAVAGWRQTYSTVGVVATVVLLACAAALEPVPPTATRHQPTSAVRSADFRLLYASQVLVSVAIFTPFAHLPSYAVDLGVSAVAAAALVSVIGAASVAGRLALGPLADRCGLVGVYRSCFAAIGGSFLLWLWPVGYPGLVAFALVLGVGYGGFVALLPAVAARRFGTGRLGSLLGVLYTSHVLGAGLGPLATGLLVARWGYLPAGAIALVCGLAGCAVLGRLSAEAKDTPRQSPSRR